MHAYANPENRQNELERADGFGVARFNKKSRKITFECWPRFSKVSEGDNAQFPGWPVTFNMAQNDGRPVKGWLPKLVFPEKDPVVQVKNLKTGEILYTIRIKGKTFQPKVYSLDPHEIRTGQNRPENIVSSNTNPVHQRGLANRITVEN